MIKEAILFLQTGSFTGGGFGNVLTFLEQSGFFDYIIPFLLIFALVFGILSKMQLFQNKAINAIISLAVGLMALQFELVPQFFSQIFPKVGIALAVILAIVILFGLFAPKQDNKIVNTIFFIAGLAIVVVVLVSSFGGIGSGMERFLQQYGGWLLLGALVLGVIIAVIASQNPKGERNFNPPQPAFLYPGSGSSS